MKTANKNRATIAKPQWTDDDHKTLVSQCKKLRKQIAVINADAKENNTKAGRLANDCTLALDSLARYLSSEVFVRDAFVSAVLKGNEHA